MFDLCNLGGNVAENTRIVPSKFRKCSLKGSRITKFSWGACSLKLNATPSFAKLYMYSSTKLPPALTNSLAASLLQKYSYIAIKIYPSPQTNSQVRSNIYNLFHTDCHTCPHTAPFIEQFYNTARSFHFLQIL